MEHDFTNDEWIAILNEIGRITKGRYNQNLYFGAGSYNLGLLMDALQYEVTKDLELKFWVDAGNEKLDRIAHYFEYGTGLNNVQGYKEAIVAKKGKLLRFRNKKGKWVSTKEVAGVRPIFMMTKAVSSINNEWDYQVQRAAKVLGLN